MVQLFTLEDGQRFVWRKETYTLISCDENYTAKVKDKLGNVINFNACADVIPLPVVNT